jgi:hypothetical protein
LVVEAEVESSSWKETVMAMVMAKQKSLDKTPKMESKTGPQSCFAMDLVTGLAMGSETGSETDLAMGMAMGLEMEKEKEMAMGLELVHP